MEVKANYKTFRASQTIELEKELNSMGSQGYILEKLVIDEYNGAYKILSRYKKKSLKYRVILGEPGKEFDNLLNADISLGWKYKDYLFASIGRPLVILER